MRRLAVVTTYGSVIDGQPRATFALNETDLVDLVVRPLDHDPPKEGGAVTRADASLLAVQARIGRVAVIETEGDQAKFVGWWQ